MASSYTLLGISGSLRSQSTNTLLVHEAARAFQPQNFTLGSIRFPLFDQDHQDAHGVPDEVMALADQILAADAVVISTPEYNKNLSGSLKNALDWLSRTGKAPLKDRPVAILSAASGKAGGERAQYSLRHCLTPFFPRVLPGPEVTIAGAGNAFDEAGQLKDPKSFEFLEDLMQALKAETRA